MNDPLTWSNTWSDKSNTDVDTLSHSSSLSHWASLFSGFFLDWVGRFLGLGFGTFLGFGFCFRLRLGFFRLRRSNFFFWSELGQSLALFGQWFWSPAYPYKPGSLGPNCNLDLLYFSKDSPEKSESRTNLALGVQTFRNLLAFDWGIWNLDLEFRFLLFQARRRHLLCILTSCWLLCPPESCSVLSLALATNTTKLTFPLW